MTGLGELLRQQQAGIAEDLVRRQFAARPALERRFGPVGRGKCVQDASDHLAYLADAMNAGDPALFTGHVDWARVMLGTRGVPTEDLMGYLELTGTVVSEWLGGAAGALATAYLGAGRTRLTSVPADLPTCLPGDAPHAELTRAYLAALLNGERHLASRMILDAVSSGVPVKEIYQHVFQPAQYEVGRLWQLNEVSVAQEHYCTAATQLIMSQLYPHVFASEKGAGTLVATCVEGDLHEIGMRMVADFFEIDGWTTFYLGANMPAEAVVDTVVQRRAQVLGISATISLHLRAVEELIAKVRARAECRDVRILVGGYPFLVAPELWRSLGADGWAPNAQEATALANRLVVSAPSPSAPGGNTGEPSPIDIEQTNWRGAGHGEGVPDLERAARDRDLYNDLSRLNNELASLEREMVRKNVELEKLNAQKNRILGMAAHDLRSPLGVIQSYSEFLEEEASDVLSPEQREFVAIIKSTSQFMLRMVTDILDVTAIEAGQLQLDRQPADLARLVRHDVTLNAVLASRKEIAVELDPLPALPPIPLDAGKIEQVLNNLITNAVKFSQRGSTVRVRLTQSAEFVTVAVSDQGQGIPEADFSKLFKPFGKASVRSTDGEQSTGLGLAIARNIVEGHGGRIWLESEVGKGSTFFFTLPLV
jgi:MerR family transcriptional regulator, light-induced transcriptional regulator